MTNLAVIMIERSLNILEVVFHLYKWRFRSHRRHQDDLVACILSDEEILRKVKESPCLPNSNGRVFQLSATTVVKLGHEWADLEAEALSMQLVQQQTDIRSPRVLRLVNFQGKHPDWQGGILMEWIPNAKSVLDVWPTLKLWRKLAILIELRYFVRQIRNITHESSSKPGPPGPEPLQFNSFSFGPHGREFWPTQDDVLRYYDDQYAYTKLTSKKNEADGLEPLPVSKILPLTFAHNDLNPCNILVDDHHRLWIIDWGSAGFYPPFFEYTTTCTMACLALKPEWFLHKIKYFTWPDEEVEEWMARTGSDWKRMREVHLRAPGVRERNRQKLLDLAGGGTESHQLAETSSCI